ncbi:hypothetical protein TRAPUB_6228 [Trametes pubescens]|uniref:Uncharacterized protein n=1 Tax=Trametes pubescens TaxID=154538 RepID=A0A1M2V6B6_TRAPU|nr:hypothetical protein TRAPUB_6228 [Trametes pubescens]
MFSFFSNKASTCAECRSLGSGKSTSKLDKRTIGRPNIHSVNTKTTTTTATDDRHWIEDPGRG